MWSGRTWEQKDALLTLSDVARRAVALIGERACAELFTLGFLTKGADGQWYLSRAGWEVLLPS
jgi:hypothetical protein